jgi:hypothetical protein
MSIEISAEHPKQKLIFFVAQDVDEETRTLVKQMLSNIEASRSWLIGPPKFIDTLEDVGSRLEDVPDETVGGIHELYSALPPNDLPREIDALQLEEVEKIVDCVMRFSLEKGVEFEFELDGRYVGRIEDGVIDKTLAQGFLAEWRKHLGGA